MLFVHMLRRVMHMKQHWKTYTIWILLAEAVGALSRWFSRNGTKIYMQSIQKPPLSPPGWVFPVIWTVLFALMGIGAASIWMSPPSKERSRSLNLFIAQLVINFFWSPIFFNLQAFGLAFFWLLFLWGLVISMTVSFWKVDPLTAKLQLPYLIWLTFAAYLNLGVWWLNR